MILGLKRDKERNSTTYKSLTEEVLGEGVEVRALTVEANLKVKNLDEITMGLSINYVDSESRDGGLAKVYGPYKFRKFCIDKGLPRGRGDF